MSKRSPMHDGRRRWLGASGIASISALLGAGAGSQVRAQHAAATPRPATPAATRPIPSSGERLPVIGLGTWLAFDVGDDPAARDARAEVVRAFFDGGGRVIDSSPMYGSSQRVIGHALARLGHPGALFSADKVWTGSIERGPAQIEASRRHWGVPRFDLMQVHNLLGWEEHLPRLMDMKAAGQCRYVGITTSEGRLHTEIDRVMRTRRIDFVQVTYNPLDREVERRILPLAQERGIAVLANRPFREGALMRALARHPVPAWAADIDCDGWAQVVLKFVVSHPAVTCAIPATRRVDHVRQNLGAMHGRMPDAEMRGRIVRAIDAL